MEGKGGVFSVILTLTSALAGLASGCSDHEEAHETEVRIKFSGAEMASRAADPDEEMISDVSLMIFDETGAAEDCFWLEDGTECSAVLLSGRKYTFCACANFGYRVYADDIDELGDIRYMMAYPDEYSRGMPMYAYQEVTVGKGDTEVTVMLERLMAKISIRMDRRRLSDDVEMYVRSVRVGNCPRSVSVFRDSRIEDEDDRFPVGFSRYGYETDDLNRTTESGLSGTISLYMLENMQGKLEGPVNDDSGKVFDSEDYRRNVCSFIEMEIEYMSGTYYSGSKGLIYRFYLGDSRNDLNVERNCHYRITVTPEDDGLSEDSWRVDKSDIFEHGSAGITAYPASYINGNIGDEIHIWCDVSPKNTPFDVGISYMEDDKAEGLYDYVIDDNGFGATLTLKKPGTGLIYMEAGDPVNDAALFIIEINRP